MNISQLDNFHFGAFDIFILGVCNKKNWNFCNSDGESIWPNLTPCYNYDKKQISNFIWQHRQVILNDKTNQTIHTEEITYLR